MKQFKTNRFSQIIYPFFVYFIIYYLSGACYRYFLQDKFGSVFCLMLAAATTLPFMIYLYYKLPTMKTIYQFSIKSVSIDILWIVGIVLVALFLNYLFSFFQITQSSQTYLHAAKSLNDGVLLFKILSNVLLIPAVEEILYRGIICNQLMQWMHPAAAILLSALMFGILHFNPVQFLYALGVGILLGLSYYKTKRLYVPYLGHALANLTIVLYFAL